MELDFSKVRQEMFAYIQNVLETPHPVFSGLPLCPFARKARLQNQIDIWVYGFSVLECQPSSELYGRIESFLQQASHDVLLVVHPCPNAVSFVELQNFVDRLNEELSSLGLVVFGGHPEDAFEVKGVRTRQDPFINFTIQRLEKLAAARQVLRATNYYDHWDDQALQAIGLDL